MSEREKSLTPNKREGKVYSVRHITAERLIDYTNETSPMTGLSSGAIVDLLITQFLDGNVTIKRV
jgi:hypothetical protein